VLNKRNSGFVGQVKNQSISSLSFDTKAARLHNIFKTQQKPQKAQTSQSSDTAALHIYKPNKNQQK